MDILKKIKNNGKLRVAFYYRFSREEDFIKFVEGEKQKKSGEKKWILDYIHLKLWMLMK